MKQGAALAPRKEKIRVAAPVRGSGLTLIHKPFMRKFMQALAINPFHHELYQIQKAANYSEYHHYDGRAGGHCVHALRGILIAFTGISRSSHKTR